MAATDYDFRLTRNEIIEAAFSKIGVLAPGEVLQGEQLTQGARALDLVVKELQNEHIFLWTEEFFTANITAGNNSVDLPVDPPILFIREGYWKKDENHYELRITQVSKDAWYAENSVYWNNTETGEPDYFCIDEKNQKILFCPTPNVDSIFNYVGVIRAKDWEISSDKGEFPARWQKALVYLLAADLADDYRIPMAEKQMLANSAAGYVQRAKSGDRGRCDDLIMGGGFCVKRKAS